MSKELFGEFESLCYIKAKVQHAFMLYNHFIGTVREEAVINNFWSLSIPTKNSRLNFSIQANQIQSGYSSSICALVLHRQVVIVVAHHV